jgi:hypothetical protein
MANSSQQNSFCVLKTRTTHEPATGCAQRASEIHNCFVSLKYLTAGSSLFCGTSQLLILHKDGL